MSYHGLERSPRVEYHSVTKLRTEEGIVRRKSAKIRHFPEGSKRDRFGNRFFSSNQFAYKDKEGSVGKFGLLLSQEGERVLKSHPGFLNIVDYLAFNGLWVQVCKILHQGLVKLKS